MRLCVQVQQGKFADFKSFWNEKEQELKEIDYQLQKVSRISVGKKLTVANNRMKKQSEHNVSKPSASAVVASRNASNASANASQRKRRQRRRRQCRDGI